MEAKEQNAEGVEGAQPADPLADAPASNRASKRYKDDLFGPVWQGIDFLELSFPGSNTEESAADLAQLKALAQSRNAEEQACAWKVIGGRTFLVKDRGAGLFAYILQDDDYYIKVRGTSAQALPLAFVQVRSEHLARIGASECAAQARNIVEQLGQVEGEATVSRIDLTVDFTTSAQLETIERQSWVTRAAYRQSHSVGERFTGWSLGQKGPLAFRLYDKLFEIATQSRKVYLFELWQSRGWIFGDVVWRAEFQFRRPTLKDFGLQSVQSVLDALPGLWSYATTDWLRLAQPYSGDENRARWPLHGLWERLQAIEWTGTRLQVEKKIRRTSSAPADKYIARAASALVTTEMAKEGLTEVGDAWDSVLGKLVGHYAKIEEWEGASMDDLLREKALVKERKFGTCLLARRLGKVPNAERQREPGEEG